MLYHLIFICLSWLISIKASCSNIENSQTFFDKETTLLISITTSIAILALPYLILNILLSPEWAVTTYYGVLLIITTLRKRNA